MPSPHDAIIFDLDGTVWDSAPGIIRCLVETLTAFDIDIPPRSDLAAVLGPPLMTMLSMLGIPDERLDDARLDYRRRYEAYGEANCALFEGVEPLLDALSSAGRPLGVATSKGDEIVERMLAGFGIDHYFDTVHAASMSSTGHGKIELVGAALSDLGASGGVMIGDRDYDIEGGRHHGLITVGVTWGYGAPGELVSAGADHIVASVSELAALLHAR